MRHKHLLAVSQWLCEALVLWAIVMLILCTLAGPAHAGGYGYSYSRGYSATYPQYSQWYWQSWKTDPAYYVRARWERSSAYSDWAWVDDGWLYTLSNGQYYRALLKSHYKQVGDATYGVEAIRRELAKVDKTIAKLADLQTSPDAIDPRDYLPDPTTMAEARQASADKAFELTIKSKERVELAQAERELEETRARNELTLAQLKVNALERIMTASAQTSADALLRSFATPEPDTLARDINIDVPDKELARYIAQNCFACHGGSKGVGGDIDFRNVRSFGAKEWKSIRLAVETGEMPKGGQQAPEAIQGKFDDQYQSVRK